jgi:transposase InsO family protein
MREKGINTRLRRKFIPTTNSNHGLGVGENLLNRAFHAEQGGPQVVSVITYLMTSGGWVYLTMVLDLFDCKISGAWP